MKAAWKKVHDLGSSTLVLTTLPDNGNTLYTSFIGDSTYMIIRPDAKSGYDLVHQSELQQKGFNFPFQLGWDGNGDKPEAALNFKHEVASGDIVILGSDGVFDNLSGLDVT